MELNIYNHVNIIFIYNHCNDKPFALSVSLESVLSCPEKGNIYFTISVISIKLLQLFTLYKFTFHL